MPHFSAKDKKIRYKIPMNTKYFGETQDETKKRLLLQWFIGFSEGSGSWQADASRKVNEYRVSDRNPQILYKINEILGFGSVHQYKRNFTFRASSTEATLFLIRLCNGKFRLNNTQKRFKNYLDFFNSRTKTALSPQDQIDIPFILRDPQKKIVLFDDYWFGGFIDSCGFFTVTQGAFTKLNLKFTLTKKGEKVLMDELVRVFGGKYYIKSTDVYYYELNDLSGLRLLLDYLKKFPLLSDKKFSLQIFEELYSLKVAGAELTPEGWSQIQKLCVDFNNIKDSLASPMQTPETFGSFGKTPSVDFACSPITSSVSEGVPSQKGFASIAEGVITTGITNHEVLGDIPVSRDRESDLQWFIGFAEGDGSWHADHKNKRNFFIITQKDPTVLYKIRDILGFGTITKPSKYYRFVVTDLKSILKLIHICNGKLVLEKTQKRFEAFVQVFNESPKVRLPLEDRKPITIIKRETKLTFDNSWLAGFIDAEGCFNGKISYKGTKVLLSENNKDPLSFSAQPLAEHNDVKLSLLLRFSLVQKGEKDFLQEIQNFFGGSLWFEAAKDAYRYELASKTGLKLLLDYLDKFPLYSIKNLSKKRFFYIFQKIETSASPYPSTPEDWAEVTKLCEEINMTSPTDENMSSPADEN
jgi:hypothetical protein